jgi:three-Cys-motif partner protein
MGTGAGDRYWEYKGLPSTLKHELLKRYLPLFAAKTGSTSAERSVVYLDGYAGRGRYKKEGKPGSAELILQVAESYLERDISFRLFFHEINRENYAALKSVVDEYRARGVQAEASPDEVIKGLSKVIEAARGLPLFLFLDPCGVGIPFEELTRVLSGPRRDVWPPTEVLLNFSLDAVRRIGGLVNSASPDEKIMARNEKTMARLDAALDGDWWRGVIRKRGVTDDAVLEIVHGFMDRLAKATKMDVVACPVSRAPSHKPVYFLVLGTRKPLGVWYFGDSGARAEEVWWNTLEAKEAAKDEETGAATLFDMPHLAHPSLKEVEAEAMPVIAENIARLAEEHGTFVVGDYPAEVFGNYLGMVTEKVVRAAVKHLYANGRISSDGVGSKTPKIVVSKPKP